MKIATLLCTMAGVTLFVTMVESDAKYKSLESIDPCSIKDSKVNECLGKSIETLIKKMRKGLPDLGIAKAEPIKVPIVGPLTLTVLGSEVESTFRNITVRGVSKLKLTNLKFRKIAKPSKIQLNMTFSMTTFDIEADVHLNGTVKLVTLNGPANFTAKLKDTKVNAVLNLTSNMVNGIKFLKPSAVGVNYTFDSATVTLTKTGKNFVTEAVINGIVKTEMRNLAKILEPYVIEKITKILMNFSKKLLKQTPYSVWLIE